MCYSIHLVLLNNPLFIGVSLCLVPVLRGGLVFASRSWCGWCDCHGDQSPRWVRLCPKPAETQYWIPGVAWRARNPCWSYTHTDQRQKKLTVCLAFSTARLSTRNAQVASAGFGVGVGAGGIFRHPPLERNCKSLRAPHTGLRCSVLFLEQGKSNTELLHGFPLTPLLRRFPLPKAWVTGVRRPLTPG